jgi:leucyl aminopeptidase
MRVDMFGAATLVHLASGIGRLELDAHVARS